MTYLWIVIVLLAIAVEAATADLVAIWFMPAALVSMVLSLLDVSIGIQVAVFFVLVVVFMLLSKLFLRRYLKRRPNEKTNADSLLGKTAIVTKRIENEAQSGCYLSHLATGLGEKWGFEIHYYLSPAVHHTIMMTDTPNIAEGMRCL